MKEEDLLDEIELVVDIANRANDRCVLPHEPGMTPPQAYDYLTLPLGHPKESEIYGALKIPVCKECFDTIMSNQKLWTLVYCLECNKSQWIDRLNSRLFFRHRLIFTTRCHNCKPNDRSKGKNYYFMEDEDE